MELPGDSLVILGQVPSATHGGQRVLGIHPCRHVADGGDRQLQAVSEGGEAYVDREDVTAPGAALEALPGSHRSGMRRLLELPALGVMAFSRRFGDEGLDRKADEIAGS